MYAKLLIMANSLVLYSVIFQKHLAEYGTKVFCLNLKNIIDSNFTWLTSYLKSRKQKVVIQATESTLLPVRAGISQGSVLGPLLFLIYVNDITETLLSLTRLYANDSSLYYSVFSVRDIEGIINYDLRNMSIWAKQWLADFNPDKTDIFSSKIDHGKPALFFIDTTRITVWKWISITKRRMKEISS